jgi:hypothetical protein
MISRYPSAPNVAFGASSAPKATLGALHSRGWAVCVGRERGGRVSPMMPKRVVAAVLVAALLLAGGGVLGSLFL